MIGGFLGAGKTTAVGRLATLLQEHGRRVGLITNDQSQGLVDTSILRRRGFDVAEIPGGCFCCRFESLQKAADELTAATRPDVFIAEPVGSCTDLVATVSYPLRRIYGKRFEIAPLSVLVDPKRAARVLGIGGGKSFSPKVVYVYEKQLEEADLIVINKIDSTEPDEIDRLEAALNERFPNARTLRVSAKTGIGCEEWLDRITGSEPATRPVMDLDYDIYAAGEAELGWFNATLAVSAPEPASLDANQLLVELTEALRQLADADGIEIAHLKLTLESGDQLAVVSATSTAGDVDLREALIDRIDGGTLIINYRAEADPAILDQHVRDTLASGPQDATMQWVHEEHFRPSYPTPTHAVQRDSDGHTSAATNQTHG